MSHLILVLLAVAVSVALSALLYVRQRRTIRRQNDESVLAYALAARPTPDDLVWAQRLRFAAEASSRQLQAIGR